MTCRHSPKGRVTNQPNGYDPSKPHASIYCCERPECIENAKFWVQGNTGMPAHYLRFGSRS